MARKKRARDEPRSIVALMPSDTPDFMLPAWISCVSWAISTPEIVQAFRDETHQQWKPSRNPLAQMIDDATGAQWEFVKAFVLWANVAIWGTMEAPPAIDAVDPVPPSVTDGPRAAAENGR